MDRPKLARTLWSGLSIVWLALMLPGPARGQGTVAALGEQMVEQFREWTGWEDDGTSPMSVHQIACLIDCLDKKLYKYGKIAVKSPDVFGQNRMTGYRSDYEDQMKTQLDKFDLVLSSYRRQSDSAALTSATSIAAALQTPRVSNSRKVSTSTTTTNVTPPALAIPLSDLFTNASKLVGQASGDLTATPSGLVLANSGATTGIGLEPNQALDERSSYLYHLNELRRINAGADSADVSGYGLYLFRMPIALLPSGDTVMGKGASVTLKARHNITPDLLPNTFRSVLLFDTACALAEALNRGLFRTDLLDDPPDSNSGTAKGKVGQPGSGQGGTLSMKSAAVQTTQAGSGTRGTSGSAPSTELIQLFGGANLKILLDAMKDNQITWYRHDPSTISWLLTELNAAHGYMRDQAHRDHPLFQPIIFEQVGQMVLQRRYESLRVYRDDWITRLRISRGVYRAGTDKNGVALDRREPIDVLSFALIVQSIFLDRQIKTDMEYLAQRKGCACGDPWALTFYDLYPITPEDIGRYEQAKAAFAAYVECKWPIHVFAVDPTVDQQNQLDLYSQRTQLQLALAIALSSGQVNFQNADSYARRTELDLETVALNRTVVGFGAGDATFGWQFFPRIQTPPQQSNPRRILGILVNNGPGPDYDLSHRKIEPGSRECYALVVMPSFVPSIRFTSVANWFDLKTRCAEQVLETTDMVRLSKKLQTARNGLAMACDPGRYRPEELEMLSDRLAQLEDMLPLQSHKVDIPFEASLTGSEIFSSTPSGLAPRLLAWYGEPPTEGKASSIFLLGTGFTVYETHAIAGGLLVPEGTNGKLDIISRNVIRIEISADAQVKVDPYRDDNGKNRQFIDVHVATPNGISNHLLVEVEPKVIAPPPPPPLVGAAPADRTLELDYVLLKPADVAGAGRPPDFVPILIDSPSAKASVDLQWPGPGIAPAAVTPVFTFPRPGAPALILSGPSLNLTPRTNTYTLQGNDLTLFLNDVLKELNRQSPLAPGIQPPNLHSTRIMLTPSDRTLAPADAQPGSGAVIVTFKYVPSLAHVTPGALKVRLTNPLVPDPTNPADLALDFLGTLPQIHTDVRIEFNAAINGRATTIGPIQFLDVPVRQKTGLRVIPEATLLAMLNPFVAPRNGLNPLQPPTVLMAGTITITPRYDGITMEPIILDNAFEVDLIADRPPSLPRSATPGTAGISMARALIPPPVRPDPSVRRTMRNPAERPTITSEDLPELPRSVRSRTTAPTPARVGKGAVTAKGSRPRLFSWGSREKSR